MSDLLAAAAKGDLPAVRSLVEGRASVVDVDKYGRTALLLAAFNDQLPVLQFLLTDGGASVQEVDKDGRSVVLLAALWGHHRLVTWLLEEGGATITERDNGGDTALLLAAHSGHLWTVQILLEHCGSDIAEVNHSGSSVWDLLEDYIVADEEEAEGDDAGDDAAAVTALLRVMVLQQAPPDELVLQLSPAHVLVVEDAARLRARLPHYLACRKDVLDMQCPLLPPLLALVHDYEEPNTTDELWATDADMLCLMRRFIPGAPS
jgi:hypothetical protein